MRQLRRIRIEVHNQKLFHTVPRSVALAAQRGQLKCRFFRPEVPPWMRFKRDYRERYAKLFRMRTRLVDHSLVTEVNSIEISDGDRRTPYELWKPGNMSEYAHSGGLRNYRCRASQTIPTPEVTENQVFLRLFGTQRLQYRQSQPFRRSNRPLRRSHCSFGIDNLYRNTGLNRIADAHRVSEVKVLIEIRATGPGICAKDG